MQATTIPYPFIVKKTQSRKANNHNNRVTKLDYEVARWPEPAYVLAVRAGFPQSTLSLYVNGRVEIPTYHLHALAKVMGKSPSDLLGYADTP